MSLDLSKQIIHTPSLFKMDDDFQDDRFCRVRVAVMHSGINRNNSRFSTECIKSAKKSFANIPILADIQEYTDEDGNTYLDYAGHTMHIEDDAFNEGEQRIIYDEKVVGVIPETNDFEIITDEETGNDYAYVTALIYREYGNYCADILEKRGGITDVSAEIACDEISYDANDKVLDVGKMRMCAVTLLGEAVAPGMAKAHAETFSLDGDNRQNQLIQIMQELKQSLDNYTAVITAENFEKGGRKSQMFESLLEKYGKTVEDITFDYENMSDEELEVAFAEAFTEEPEAESEAAAEPEAESETTPEPEQEPEDQFAIKYSVSYGESVKEFSVSLGDIIYALSSLVNETYGDDGYYDVDVFADDGYVIMRNWYDGRAYKQTYKHKKDSYSLTGDRVPVKAVYVTEDEERKLDEMRANYSSISDKLAKYEAEPSKMEILSSEEYSAVADTEAFIELMSMENHFDLSVDEVREKADAQLLAYAKTQKFAHVDNTEHNKVSKKEIPNFAKKPSRYGNLFKK